MKRKKREIFKHQTKLICWKEDEEEDTLSDGRVWEIDENEEEEELISLNYIRKVLIYS